MSHFSRIPFVFSLIYLISVGCFSQDVDSPGNSAAEPQDRSSKTEGLRKIETRSWDDNFDLDIHIDEEALDASIESAVGDAMESIEAIFDELEIHIDPIEIDLGHLDFVDPDINIEPIEIALDHLDIAIECDDNDWDQEDDEEADDHRIDQDTDQTIEKNKVQDKSGKKDKTEGLKKID